MKQKGRFIFKQIIKVILLAITLAMAFLVSTNLWVLISSEAQVKHKVKELNKANVGLVLGTSKKLISGHENPYFKARIKAAAQLYKAGIIKHVLVSGDNRSKYYNEPHDMQQALIKQGVPKSSITLDYAGLRTLDSIVRCKEIFRQNEFIIITQKFHARRALFISNYYHSKTQAYVAASPPLKFAWKVKFREMLARPLAVIDLYILRKKPKHKGNIEPILFD